MSRNVRKGFVCTEEEASMIDRAAEYEHRSVASFMRLAALAWAKSTLQVEARRLEAIEAIEAADADAELAR